jgi:hypothetical protein
MIIDWFRTHNMNNIVLWRPLLLVTVLQECHQTWRSCKFVRWEQHHWHSVEGNALVLITGSLKNMQHLFPYFWRKWTVVTGWLFVRKFVCYTAYESGVRCCISELTSSFFTVWRMSQLHEIQQCFKLYENETCCNSSYVMLFTQADMSIIW